MSRHTLTLMRHAKSSWKSPGLSDHDRPLNTRGERDAPDMAARLLQRGTVPDLVLSSSALRAVATARLMLARFKADLPAKQVPDLMIEPELYLASPKRLLEAVSSTDAGIGHLLVIAHNPGLEDLTALLCGEAVAEHLPTAAVRQFQFPAWDQTDQALSLEQSGEASQRSKVLPGVLPGVLPVAVSEDVSGAVPDTSLCIQLIHADSPKSVNN